MVQQFIHGTQYIDELVMVRVKNKGDLYVHQGERSERERVATGKASRMRASDPRARPQRVSTMRTSGGANWNVIGLTDLGGRLVERYVYTPYGELTVHQVTGYGDRDGDGTVDSDDKGTPGTTCTGTVSGECRILDLDFDGDYDSTDAGEFDNLPQGLAQHPGRTVTGVDQPFAHQGLLYDAEIMTYQNRARQYDPGKRRFVQRDPLALWLQARAGFRVHLNLYVYHNLSPLRYLDPMGEDCAALGREHCCDQACGCVGIACICWGCEGDIWVEDEYGNEVRCSCSGFAAAWPDRDFCFFGTFPCCA